MMTNPLSESYEIVVTALCVWREARGESYAAQQGVAWCIRNRMADPRWPDLASGVVLQRLQFSSFNANDPNAVKLPAAGDASWKSCCEATVAVFVSGAPDFTVGANHYHDTSIASPPWTVGAKLTVQIGRLKFYKR